MRDPFSLRTTSNTGVKTLILTIFVTFFTNYLLSLVTCSMFTLYLTLIKFLTMKTIHINRHELLNGMWDIEKMVADVIKADLGAKKVTVDCITRNWQGHICPSFKASADGVKLLVHGNVDPYQLEIDPWSYDMDIDYMLV